MRKILGALFGGLLLPAGAALADEPPSNGGIVIPYNSHTGHPSILLAWRNTQKIFEAEVLVQNYSSSARQVGVRLDLLDDSGRLLLNHPHGEDFSKLSLPGREFGGAQGSVVQIRGSREANLLIDLLDREKKPYHIRAAVFENIGTRPTLIETATRSIHASSPVYPRSELQQNFGITNDTDSELSYEVSLQRHGYDFGVTDTCAALKEAGAITLKPKQTIQCFVRLKAQERVEANKAAAIWISWVGRNEQSEVLVRDKREWYLSSDGSAPEIRDVKKTVTQDGAIHFEVLAAAGVSGIEEASGVRLEYSLDDGITFSNRVMAYLDGNFQDPTRFLATLGPFREGTHVAVWITVTNGIGKSVRLDMGKFQI